MSIYIGPSDIWRRFMSGMSITQDNYVADESPWWITSTPKLHLQQMQAMVDAEDESDDYRSRFNDIVGDVRL